MILPGPVYTGLSSFYALTEGWESFSETGGGSLRVGHRKKELISDTGIIQQARELIFNHGFVQPESVQLFLVLA